ncbi:MAG: hypothetical protein PCFJNLEI_03313 [Verrucomicrobiae bacterium]|nr:hypothetical protein [Verrucomicrobiae bacterium]
MTMHTIIQSRATRLKRLIVIGITFAGTVGAARASVTNAIWEARFFGDLAIQSFLPDVTPRASVSKIKKGTFLSIVLNTSPSGSQKLAFNVDMISGKTNFYLTVFDQSSRQNTLRVSTAERTTIISDGEKFIFSLDADLRPNPPQWGGGFIRIVGRGRMVNGVPARLKGAATGVFVDNRPGDLNGTTGLVMRAKISTGGAPLRIQPAN